MISTRQEMAENMTRTVERAKGAVRGHVFFRIIPWNMNTPVIKADAFVPVGRLALHCLEGLSLRNHRGRSHIYPLVDMGNSVEVGGRMFRASVGPRKGQYYFANSGPEWKGVKATPAGVTKKLEVGTGVTSLNPSAHGDRSHSWRIEQLLNDAGRLPISTRFTPPPIYVAVDSIDTVVPAAEEVDSYLFYCSKFGLMGGMPKAPSDGVVTEVTDKGVKINGNLIPAISTDIAKEVKEAFHVSPVINLYPIVKSGQTVTEGTTLFSVCPSGTAKDNISNISNIEQLRWYGMRQHAEITDSGVVLLPIKFVDSSCTAGAKYLRTPVTDDNSAPVVGCCLPVDGGGSGMLVYNSPFLNVDFRDTCHYRL